MTAKMKKNVAHFVEAFPASGENYVYSQVIETQIFSSRLYSEYALNSNYNAGVEAESYLQLSHSKHVNRIFRSVRNHILPNLQNAMFCNWCEKKLTNHPPDLLHTHFGTMGFKIINLKKKINVPLVVTFYGVDISNVIKDLTWQSRYKEMAKYADRLIVLFDEGVERLVKLGFDPKKITVWDIGIPISDYPYRTPNHTDKTIKFLITARFVEKKGYFVLINAFNKALKKHPNLTLTIIGNGPLKNEILAKTNELHLSEKVQLIDTAHRDDFFSLFKSALHAHDIFVLPSVVADNGDDEGGPPVVLTNAMAVGLPIISTNIGGISRAIEHNKTGLLSTSGDSEDLYKKMIYLIENKNLWEGFALKGRQLAESRFDLNRQIAKLENIYTEILADYESK